MSALRPGPGVSQWTRWFTVVSAGFLVIWQIGSLVGTPRRTAVHLAVLGFVFHMIFGKAYLLIPSYFKRTLPNSIIPGVHLCLTTSGTIFLAMASLPIVDSTKIAMLGVIVWGTGIMLFLGLLGWAVRDALTAPIQTVSEFTTTQKLTEWYAIGFVPIALAYLAIGSYELLALHTALPGIFDGYQPRTTHLLAAGGAALLLFALGTRLLPQFLGVSPVRPLVVIILPAGAVGPLLLAMYLGAGWGFRAGAVFEAIAVLGFTLLYTVLLRRSKRRRVGFYGILSGLVSGSGAVGLGLLFAFTAWTPKLVTIHIRLNLVGFLGLTIIGFAYQFYPPTAGHFRGADDRTALLTILLIVIGLVIESVGFGIGNSWLAQTGTVLICLGAIGYAYLISRLLNEIVRR